MAKYTTRITVDIVVEADSEGTALQRALLIAREVDQKSPGRASVRNMPTSTKEVGKKSSPKKSVKTSNTESTDTKSSNIESSDTSPKTSSPNKIIGYFKNKS